MDDQKPMPQTDDDAVDTSGSTGGTPVDEEEEIDEAPAPAAEPGIGEPVDGEAPVKAEGAEDDEEEEIE